MPKPAQAYEPEVPVEVREWIRPSYPMMIDLERNGDRLTSERSLSGYVNLFVKAQAIRLLDRVRGIR